MAKKEQEPKERIKYITHRIKEGSCEYIVVTSVSYDGVSIIHAGDCFNHCSQ